MEDLFRMGMGEMRGLKIPLIQMAAKACSADNVHDDLMKLFRKASSVTCIDESIGSKVNECIMTWLDERSDMGTISKQYGGKTRDNNTTDNERIQSLIRFGHSAFQCVRNLVRAICPKMVQDTLLHAINETIPTALRYAFRKDQVDIPLTQTYVVSTQRSTVGFYGNNHLLLYNVDTPMSCSMNGYVKFLSNQLFTINGFSERSEDTGISKLIGLEIVFYRPGGGVIGGYLTELPQLPDTFDIDDTELDTYGAPIQISSIVQGTKIQINSTSRAYIILIQKQSSGYSLTLRISERVLKTSSGVLISGCSFQRNEVIDISQVLDGGAQSECQKPCEDSQIELDDVIIDLTDTCVFDCIIEQRDSSEAAKAFKDDVMESHAYDDNLTLVEPPPQPGQARVYSTATMNSAPIILFILAMYLAVASLNCILF